MILELIFLLELSCFTEPETEEGIVRKNSWPLIYSLYVFSML